MSAVNIYALTRIFLMIKYIYKYNTSKVYTVKISRETVYYRRKVNLHVFVTCMCANHCFIQIQVPGHFRFKYQYTMKFLILFT